MKEIVLFRHEVDVVIKEEDKCGINTLLQECLLYKNNYCVIGYLNNKDEVVKYKVLDVTINNNNKTINTFLKKYLR